MDGQENVQGVENQEAATPETTVTEPVNNTAEGGAAENAAQATAEPTADNGRTEEDARFAAVRRKAEEDAKIKYGAESKRLNDDFKQMFGDFKNPETGKPIETAKDYISAIKAQQKQARDAKLREKGIDPSMIEDMVNNSPIVQQANAMLQQNAQAEAQRQLEADIKTLGEIDPTIKSLDDLTRHPSYAKVYKLVNENGLSIVDAYKLANYSALSARQNAAVKQAAINQAKGKNHLEATGAGRAAGKDLVEVPASTMVRMREFYPDLTDEQIKVKYNETL